MDHRILTCIIPVTRVFSYFNRLSLLVKEISSFEQIELIVIHDVQDPDSTQLLNSILDDFPEDRLKYFSGIFGNPGDTRNFAMGFVSTPWLIFVDGDDYIFTSHYLEVLKDAIEAEADIAVAGIRVTNINNPNQYSDHTISQHITVEENLSLMPAFTRLIYNTNFVKGLIFPSLSMAEDQCFLFSVLLRKPKFFVSNKIVYEYFVGSTSQLTVSSRALRDLRKSIKILLQRFDSVPSELTGVAFIFLLRQLATLIARSKNSLLYIIIILLPNVFQLIIKHPFVFFQSLRKILYFRKALIIAR